MQLREYFRRYFHEQSYWEPTVTIIPGRRGPKRPRLVANNWLDSVVVREGWLKARYPLSCAVARLAGTPLEDMEIQPQELPVI